MIENQKLLYIYGGEEDKIINKNNKFYFYQLSSGSIIGNCKSLNDSKLFLSLSKSIRNNFVEYIYSLNKLSLAENFIYNKDLSLFFLSDLSNKRTEVYSTYQYICHIKIIEKLLVNYKIEKIILSNVSNSFFKTFYQKFNGNFTIKKNNVKKSNFGFFTFFIRQLQFLLNLYGSILINFFLKKKINKIKDFNFSSLFLTRYPKHFSNEVDNKYKDFFKIDSDTYLLSILSDGFHQKVTIKQYFHYCRELSNVKFKFFLIDSLISMKDVLKFIYNSLLVLNKIERFRKNNFFFKNINIRYLIEEELFISAIRIPRLLVYENSMKKFLNKSKINFFYYYLFEFCYGRFFTYMFKKYSNKTKTIGFQHGPNSQRHIMFYLSRKEPAMPKVYNYLDSLPIPDKVIAENKYSEKVYNDGGFRNIEIMKKIPRLNYLEKVKRKKIKKNTFLVAAAMHDGLQMFRFLKNEMIKNVQNEYYFKFHPRAERHKNKVLELNKPNIVLADRPLIEYLSFVSNVVVTQSSVGYEAFLLNIPVRVISLPNKINDSPLVDIYSENKVKLITLDFS